MKKQILIIGLILSLISCKGYEIAFDPRPKTHDMLSKELYTDHGPYSLFILFESSLENDYIKIEAPAFETRTWDVYFEGKLDECDQNSCKIIEVSSTLYIDISINGKKIELDDELELPLTAYKYLFVSKADGKYKLYFTNYPKVVW